MREQFLWTEKYRPHKIEDIILPSDFKATFKEFMKKGDVPNMLLVGSAGVGKTTIARAILEELGCDYLIINASMNGNIDTLRNEIKSYASSLSLTGGRKYVILDEADHLNPVSTQPALRNFMEEYSRNCGFIMTANFKNKIIEPLHSRCAVVEFKLSKKDMPELASQFLKRACWILDQENVEFDKKVVAQLISKFYPDWRRVLNELQRYSSSGSIDSGILANVKDVSIKNLIDFLKAKDFTSTRKWVVENGNNTDGIFRSIYDSASEYLTTNAIPAVVLILAKYQYQSAFAADQEINLVACLTEIMVEAEWK